MQVWGFPKVLSVLKHAQKRTLLRDPQIRGFAVSVVFLTNNGEYKEGRTHVRDAVSFLTTILGEHDSGLMFAGTGHFIRKTHSSRLIVIHFDRNFLTDPVVYLNPKQLLDVGFNPKHRHEVNECLSASCDLHVYSGVLDFVNNSRWAHGFTVNPYSIFSHDERICLLKGSVLYTSVYGIQHVFDVAEIEHIGVWVSKFPHSKRRLVLGLKGPGKGETTTMALIDISSNDISGDLFKLAVDTEWLLKAAALLCAKMKRQGNKDLYMKVSPPLQPKNNVWIAIQQKKWMKMVKEDNINEDF